MFNSYTIQSGPSSLNATINVEEHRAPTDKSVELYDKMLDKAKMTLINQFIVDDNKLKGKIFVFKDLRMDKLVVHILFTLNGHEYKITKSVDNTSAVRGSLYSHREALIKGMRDAIFEQLVENIELDQGIR